MRRRRRHSCRQHGRRCPSGPPAASRDYPLPPPRPSPKGEAQLRPCPPPWQRGLRSSSLPLGSEGFALPPSPLAARASLFLPPPWGRVGEGVRHRRSE